MPLADIVARLSGRRTCGQCRAVFHVAARPPRAEAVCDHCGGPLVQREDDRPEAVRVRMQAYEKDTAPLVQYYRRRRLLVPLAADGTPEQVLTRAVSALESLAPRVAPA
jgi:adenylate kinase